MNKSTSSPKKIPILRFLIGAVIVAAAAMAIVSINRRPADAPGPLPSADPNLTAEEADKLIRLAQVATGHLENIEFSKADALYTEIVDRLPTEPLGVRNQAICRYLQFEVDQEKRETTAARLQSSLARLQELEPNESSTHWLLGKVSAMAGPTAAAETAKHFERAAILSPDEVVFWYEAYAAARLIPGGEARAKEFLKQAHRLAPDNLFLLGDWLVVLARSEDAAMGEALAAAKTTYAPLRDTALKLHQTDVIQLLNEASEALARGDWNLVVRNVRGCQNVTISNDFTQGDERALAPHALEFVVHDFSDRFMERFPPRDLSDPLIDMSFARAPSLHTGDDIRDAVLVDVNLDTNLDLLVLEADQLTVYQSNDTSGWAKSTSLELKGSYLGILAADLDRDRDYEIKKPPGESAEVGQSSSCFDADTDVIVYGESGVLVIRNVRTGNLRSLEIVAQDPPLDNITDVVTAILVDFDHDSNLDIVCSTKTGVAALLGKGAMAFTDVSRFSSFPNLEASQPITSLVAVDWDRDVDIDIVAVAEGQHLGYLENLRHGNFRWQSFGSEYATLADARSLAVVESDGNVSWDILGMTATGVTLVQTRTPHSGRVQFESAQSMPIEHLSESTHLIAADVDNNSQQDAIVWTPEKVSIVPVNQNGSLAKPLVLTDTPDDIRSCDFGDVDNDGDLDLCIVGSNEVVLLTNESGNENNWLAIRALGEIDNAGKANHHGIGSLLEVKAGTHYQAQVVAKPVTHFGLGKEPNAAIVRFLWTNGVPQDLLEPAANQAVCEVMSLKGSCPYVYTWTGERFEFFTDCLWAAPIGLQLAEDVLAPTRSWEYLRIPGDRLREKGGVYSLQVTEELWEAGYFDLVDLIAVDHPADVEIFSNEKVGPAEISEFKLHTVRHRRTPLAARDQRGRDVLPQIRERDDVYLRAFDSTIVPGLAEEHFLELDLGQLESPNKITLFLTGWIYPTDTSLNVALSRHPQAGGPRPPSVLVPDADGNWQEVQAYMGFPGGKTKTITVDLSDAFLTKDYRLRIATSAEIYWDEVFFTVDDEPADIRTTSLALASADLHYRGFSRVHPQQPNAPETYDYAQVRTASKWPPMRGAFTRYGDVLELVTAADDRMVVLGGGDEMTLRFHAPEAAPPEGWTRDFIMHNVGWDKDADLNTIYGQSVEPLPYREMKSYPYGPESPFPSTPLHQEYLKRYQTRVQGSQRFWRHIKNYSVLSSNALK